MNYHWFRYIVRESNIDYQHSLRGLIRAHWQSLHSLIPSRLSNLNLRSQIPTLPFSIRSNTSSPPGPELGKLVRPVDPGHITPFVTAETDSTLLRSDSETSKRSSLTTSTSTSKWRRLESLKRSYTSNSPLFDVPSESDRVTNATTDNGYTTTYGNHDKEGYLFQSSQTTTIFDNSEQLSIDVGEVRIGESPVSPMAGWSTIASGGDRSPRTPGTFSGMYRPLTYATMSSQRSIMTLPLYREQEDDQLSLASRAPTYRSRGSTRQPRTPLRITRPPLPPPTFPLPVPPSSYIMAKL